MLKGLRSNGHDLLNTCRHERRNPQTHREHLLSLLRRSERVVNINTTRAISRSDAYCLPMHRHEFTHLVYHQLDQWQTIDVSDPTVTAPIQVIDFFSGAGGMSLGFAALSQLAPIFRITGGCDIDPDAATTFQFNIGAPGIVADVRRLARDSTSFKRFLSQLDRYDPTKPTVVIGCAPCQGFTSHRKRHWSEADRRNSLVRTFAEIAVRLNPVCVIMENVPEMLCDKYWRHFAEARDILTGAGFVVHQAIYNVAAFGVPQERFRALVVAMKRDFVLPLPVLAPKEYATVRDAIGDLPPVKPGVPHPHDPMHRCAGHRKSTIETIRAVPKNGGSRPPGVGPKCLDRVNGFYDVYGRLKWKKPAVTITHYARNPASGRYVHPEQNRGLTMREAARLQSFPDGFVFHGTFDSIFKQIGEAVPPKFSAAVAVNTFIELVAPALTNSQTDQIVPSIREPISNSFSSTIAGLKKNGRAYTVHLR